MKFLFVYNANSDKISVALDFMHKIIRPSTYECDLCAITYGNFGIKKEWEDFIKQLPVKAECIHKDEFRKMFPEIRDDWPAVYKSNNDEMKVLISASEMQSRDLKAWMNRGAACVE